jgi:hypothetical protein
VNKTRRHAPGLRGSAADLAAQSVLLLIERAMLGAGQVAVVEARHEALCRRIVRSSRCREASRCEPYAMPLSRISGRDREARSRCLPGRG